MDYSFTSNMGGIRAAIQFVAGLIEECDYSIVKSNLVYCPDALGAESRDRTGDTRIFSPVLYRLSYLGSRLVGDAGLEPAASTL